MRRTDLNQLPSGALLPARELVRNASGGPVADSDFLANPPTFQVFTSEDQSAEWFFLLDMDPAADIVIQGEA